LLDHKPFLVISDYLTRQGIAVLRCDDRGVGKSQGVFGTATTADFVTDIRSAYAYLKTRKEIDPKKIGLIGHSEGGIIGPIVASQDRSVAFVVMLAGTGVNGEQVVLSQAHAISVANGVKPADIETQDRVTKAAFNIIKGSTDKAKIKKELVDLLNDENNKLPEDKRLTPKQVEATADAQVASLGSPWFRYFLSFEPSTALKKVKCPVLVLNGTKDLQVIASINVPAIEKALKAGGNKKYEIHLLPGLNHLFQKCTTGSPNEYANISETMSPDVLKLVSDWILKTARR
jgi:alpha/beta superfamily hydrolase